MDRLGKTRIKKNKKETFNDKFFFHTFHYYASFQIASHTTIQNCIRQKSAAGRKARVPSNFVPVVSAKRPLMDVPSFTLPSVASFFHDNIRGMAFRSCIRDEYQCMRPIYVLMRRFCW